MVDEDSGGLELLFKEESFGDNNQESDEKDVEEKKGKMLELAGVEEGNSVRKLREEMLVDNSLEVMRRLAKEEVNGYYWKDGILFR